MLMRVSLTALSFILGAIVFSQSKVISIPGSDQAIQLEFIKGGAFTNAGEGIQIPDFYIGAYEITYGQYKLFQSREYDTDDSQLENYNADAVTRPTPTYEDYTKGMGKEGGYPAVSMTQQAAVRYCQWLYQKTGIFFRLPTEAEWQYACMQGQTEKEPLENIAWNFQNSYETYHQVGNKMSNDLGLYDMIGNVAEWTADQYTEEYQVDTTLWVLPTRRHSRTVKGGSYLSDPEECTCTYRERSNPRWQMRDPQIPKSEWWNTDAPFVGFRVLMPSQQPLKDEIEAYFQKAIVY